jgi:hypothetical protein
VIDRQPVHHPANERRRQHHRGVVSHTWPPRQTSPLTNHQTRRSSSSVPAALLLVIGKCAERKPELGGRMATNRHSEPQDRHVRLPKSGSRRRSGLLTKRGDGDRPLRCRPVITEPSLRGQGRAGVLGASGLEPPTGRSVAGGALRPDLNALGRNARPDAHGGSGRTGPVDRIFAVVDAPGRHLP